MSVDLTALYRPDSTHDEMVTAFQHVIDNGQAWRLEGSIGRMAMALIESGDCTLGPVGHRDYWGNYVPSRDEVEPGSKGSREYQEAMRDDR